MKLRKIVLAVASVLILTLPAAADTAPAEDYVANVRQRVVFLTEASRLAGQRASSDKVRAFAQAEMGEERVAANDLKLWETGRALSAFGPSMLVTANGTVTGADGPDTIMTGRSIAVDAGPTLEWSRPEPGVAMVSPGVLVMPQLETLQGAAFDELYKKTQVVALKELAGFYEAYSLTGKDATLRAMAQRELPRVKRRMADLEAL